MCLFLSNLLIFFKGASSISNLIFFHQPDATLKLYITSDVIKKYFKNLLDREKRDFDINLDENYNFEINLHLRRCQPGEYYISLIKKLITINIFLIYLSKDVRNVELESIH